jgi:N-acetylneuraminic acid mutarotase
MMLNPHCIYRFGGTDAITWYNDLWCYDTRSNTWEDLSKQVVGYIPAGREGHAAAVADNFMYVFGGRTADGRDRGDLAALDLLSLRWFTFQNMGPSPSARSGHAMVTLRHEVIVLGGEPESRLPSNEADLTAVYVLDTRKIRYPEKAKPV